MGYFLPEHRLVIKKSLSLAEHVLESAVDFRFHDRYDVFTASDTGLDTDTTGVFAQLFRVEHASPGQDHHYRVCLVDGEILSFLGRNTDITLDSLVTFIMTHELLHIHRFFTRRADFEGDPVKEEAVVDALTRVILARHPVIGLKRVLSLLDRIKAAPLYNGHILNEVRCIDAYL